MAFGQKMSRNTKISGALLRTLRKEAGYSQETLAMRIGISRETVSAIENEKPGTIDTIGAEVISRWHMACHSRATTDTRSKFLDHVLKYFGISHQTIMNVAKSKSDEDDQNTP